MLTAGSGIRVNPDARLGAGRRGEVYTVGSQPGIVFKRYSAEVLAADRALEGRLLAMIARPPAGGGQATVAWPTDVVRDGTAFAGFLMPAVDLERTLALPDVVHPVGVRATPAHPWSAGYAWRDLVAVGAAIADAVRRLHDAGIVLGGLTVRVTAPASVTVLGCDSMDIGTRTSGDLRALAICLYELLMGGEHPFRGRWRAAGTAPSEEELAATGTWTHRTGGRLAPPAVAVPVSVLPPGVFSLFRRAFEDGARNPAALPTAYEWHSALVDLAGGVTACRRDPAHGYPATLRKCPWCAYQRAQLSYRPKAAPPAGGPDRPVPAARTAGRRRAVALILVGAVIAAVVTAIVVTSSHPAPVPPSAAQLQAAAMRQVVEASTGDRSSVEAAIGNVRACRQVSAAATTLSTSAKRRRDEYAQAQALAVDALPAGPQLQADLVEALRYSYQADDAYVSWAKSLTKHCAPSTNQKSATYKRASSLSRSADTAKNSFVRIWNGMIVGPYGQPSLSPTGI